MTILQLFEYLQEVKPHQYDENILMIWLNELEKEIFEFYQEFIDSAQDAEEFVPHTDSAETLNTDEVELYRMWLSAKIDFANNEFTYYNNDVLLFNEMWESFQADYARKHKSKLADKYIKI